MTDYQLDILNNIETRLLEYLANFLDDEDQVLDEKLADIEHRDYRSDCELHIKMAKAALEVYKQNVDFNSPHCAQRPGYQQHGAQRSIGG